MKFSISRSPFMKALSHGQSVVEKRTTLPILSHVLLCASNGKLSLTTTDIDLALIETVDAQIENEGSLCVPASMLYDITRKLNDRFPLQFEYFPENSILELSCGRSVFKLSTLNAGDFPKLSLVPLTHHFSLPTACFKNLLESTKFCMSNEETRYHLNGVHLHPISPKGVRIVATDMHRLAYADYPELSNLEDLPEVIISRKTVHELLKLLETSDGVAEIGLSENRIEVSLNTNESSAVLTSRLIDGRFPDYQEALNIKHAYKVIAPTKELAQALDRVGTVINDRLKAVKISLSDQKIILSTDSQDFGSAKEEIDVDYSGTEPLEMCFNSRYLLEIIEHIETEETEIQLTDSDASIFIRAIPPSSEIPKVTALFVLMPLRD